jgi:hypothetical protein
MVEGSSYKSIKQGAEAQRHKVNRLKADKHKCEVLSAEYEKPNIEDQKRKH